MTTARISFCVLALLAVGCGGDDDDDASGGLSCTDAACGGDIAGVWTIDETCPGVEPAENEQCPSAVIEITEGPHLSGTATFNADLTYALDIDVTGQVAVTIPPECTLNGTVTCEALQGVLDDDFPGATCAAGVEANSCACDMPIDTDADEQGTYTVDGSTLSTVAEDDGDPSTDESNESQFCVQGSDLLVIMTNELGQVSVLGHM